MSTALTADQAWEKYTAVCRRMTATKDERQTAFDTWWRLERVEMKERRRADSRRAIKATRA